MQAQDPRTPTRTPSQTPARSAAASSVPRSGNAAALSAALQGATLAFQAGSGQKPTSPNDRRTDPISPSPGWLRVPPPSENGAVQAATRAASQAARDLERSRSPTGRQPVSRHGTGSSVQSTGAYNRDTREKGIERDSDSGLGLETSPRPSLLSVGNSPSLLTPGGRPGTDRKQASFIAATLAASRSGTPSPNHTGQSPAQVSLTPTQLHSRISRSESFVGDNRPTLSPAHDIPQLTDTTSIPPATSLISLFESKKDDMDPVKKSDPVPRQQRSSAYPKVYPPTPPRSRTPELDILEKPKPKPKPKPANIADNIVTGKSKALEKSGPAKGDGKPERQSDDLLRAPVTARHRPAQDHSSVEPQEVQQQTHASARQDHLEDDERRHVTSEPLAHGPELTSLKIKKVPEKPSGEKLLLPTRRSTNIHMSRSEPPPTNRQNIRDTQIDLTMKDYASSKEEVGVRRMSEVSTSSADTFVSASSTQSPRAMSPVKDIDSGSRGTKQTPGDRSPQARPALPPRNSSSNNSVHNLPLDSLSNAILAGNLASARLSSASVTKSQGLPPPVPAPRRQGNRSHNPLHKHKQLTGDSSPSSHGHHRNVGSKSPQRTGMLQTLRGPATSKSDDEDARRHMHKHRKKKLTGNRKHAHQEGSRRRWRDEITTRERRRYEAVWASNRGLFLRPGFVFTQPETWRRSSPTPSPSQRSAARMEDGDATDEETAMWRQIEQGRAPDGTPEADYVVNVVVRDLWSRSRLPPDELAEVWDLVDRKKEGVLGKQEFVVGMWLIDQRLRGRKIPARVSESVWESARGMGMKVLPVPVPKDARGRKGRRS
ncbi:hypothetical protein V8F20_004441 [Naviculisporaceae sp. PSN 640]